MPLPSPHDWKAYAAPSNWFRFRYPPEWNLVEVELSARLTAPDGSVVTVECRREEPGSAVDFRAAADIPARFPGSIDVKAVDAPNTQYASTSFQGTQRLKSRRGWLGGLIARPSYRKWQMWLVRHASMLVVIECRFARQETEPVGRNVVRLIETLKLAVEPADPPQKFAERVLALAREKFPLLPCELSDDLQLKLGESRINLFNFYRLYMKAPGRFREIVMPALTTVVQVQEWGPDQTEPPLERVRDRIYPMLYPERVWRENFSNFCGTPWIADLMILYVVDESQAYWYIRDDLPAKWNLDLEELHAIALENLERHFDEAPMDFTLAGEENGPRLLMPNRPDAYNATRILSGTFHRRLRELLGPEVAVGIPSRDFFVAVSLDSENMVDEVRTKVAEDFATLDHPVCDQLLLLSLDGISQFLAPRRE